MDNNNLLIEIYKNFNEKMLELAHRYFVGMYKNHAKKVFKSHEYIYKIVKEGLVFNKYEYHEYVFEDKNYIQTKVSSLLSRHLKHIKEIVIISESNNINNEYTELMWSDYLISNRLKRNIKNNISKNENVTELEPFNFMRKYIVSREKYYYANAFSNEKKINQKLINYDNYIESFEVFSDQLLLQLYIAKKNIVILYNTPDEFDAKSNQLIEKYINREEFYLSLNAFILKLQNKFEINLFYKFYNTVFDNMKLLSIFEKPFYINMILNFIYEQIKRKDKKFIDIEYNTYKFLETNDLLFINPKLGYRSINNIVKSYLYKNKIEDATLFLNKYINKIDVSIKDSCFYFNRANIHFYKGNYDKVLPDLNKVRVVDSIYYRLNIKKLEILNMIMLKDFEVVKYHINSLKKYIIENDFITPVDKADIKFMLKVALKLCKPMTKKDKIILTSLLENHDVNDRQLINWFSVILNRKS